MRILRYEVPVDGFPHGLILPGFVVKVAAAGEEAVEIWAEEGGKTTPFAGVFQVFGTGADIPKNAIHVGTTERTPKFRMIWHLYEIVD